MPTYDPAKVVKAADMGLVKTAISTAQSLGASADIILADLAAGIVESDLQNLDHGPDGSRGYLQQRSSQGWPDPMNITTATKSFVSSAKKIKTYSSIGQLAQKVQRSAYPARYDEALPAARAVLAAAGGAPDSGGLAGAVKSTLGGIKTAIDDTNPVTAFNRIADAVSGMAGGVNDVGKFAETLGKLALPTTMVRVAAGGLGIVFVFIGIFQLGREIKG